MSLSSPVFYDRFSSIIDSESNRRAEAIQTVDSYCVSKLGNKTTCLLDVGCGNGKRLSKLLGSISPKSYRAIDSSPTMVKQAKINGIDAISADIETYNPGIKFDAILALWNILGHLESQDSAIITLQNIANLLREGGIFILDLNNRHNISQYGFRAVRNLLNDIISPKYSNGDFTLRTDVNHKIIETKVHIYCYSEIKKLIDTSGLTIKQINYYNYSKGGIVRSRLSGQMLLTVGK